MFLSLSISTCFTQTLVSPVLDSVSVNKTSGMFELGWEPSTSANTTGYIINLYEFAFGIGRGIPIDTVYGINTTSWISNSKQNPSEKEYSFFVQSIDNALHSSSFKDFQQNVFLQKPTVESCSNQIKIQWLAYKNMQPALSTYKVYMSTNGGAFSLLADVGSAALEYTFTTPVSGSSYTFYIQSVSTTGYTASSNKRSVAYGKVGVLKYLYLNSASVNANNFVDIQFYADTTGITKSFALSRSEDGLNYKPVDTIVSTEASSYIFTDSTSTPSLKSYYYKIDAVDVCGNTALTSNTARTIFLTGKALEGLRNELKWNTYEGFLNGVNEYEIYRIYSNGTEVLEYSSITNEWTDDISNFKTKVDRFNYRIKAIEDGVNVYGLQDVSYSNIIYIKQKPLVYIPNAFAPSGNNNTTFAPITTFLDAANYSFAIYSRWGGKVFETTNKEDVWDGRFDGRDLPMDLFNYVLKYLDENNEIQTIKGVVTLIR